MKKSKHINGVEKEQVLKLIDDFVETFNGAKGKEMRAALALDVSYSHLHMVRKDMLPLTPYFRDRVIAGIQKAQEADI